MDRIDPIRPRPPAPQRIPAIRRTPRSDEDREQPGSGREDPQRHRADEDEGSTPPDDGRPHIDVRV